MGFVVICPPTVSALLSESDGTVSGKRKNGEWARGKVHAKCEEGWLEGLVDWFLVGLGVVGIVLEGVLLWFFLNGGVVIILQWVLLGFLCVELLGFFLSGGCLDSSRWASWGWGWDVVFVLKWQSFLALSSLLSFLLFKFWVTSMGTSLLVWVFLGLEETIFMVLVKEYFALLVEVVMKGSFGSMGKKMGVVLFLVTGEDIGACFLGIGVLGFGSLSESSAFLRVSLFLLHRVGWVFRTWRIFRLWGRFSSVAFRWLRRLYGIRLLWRFLKADFCKVADLLTILAVRPPDLYHHHHLSIFMISGMAWKPSLSRQTRNI